MKQIEGKIRKACVQYGLIEAGDRVAVGVSGGKDSVALLAGLCAIRRYLGVPFELVALTLDPCFGDIETDYGPVAALCDALHVPHVVKRTNLGAVIFDIRQEKNPCALCARMRRGALHDLAVAHGCNKIALGHHMDDVVETFFLNLYHEGRIAAFSPKSYLSRKDLTMIRPMIYLSEAEITGAVTRAGLPVVKSRCPMDGNSERQRMKEMVAQKSMAYPGFLRRTFTALQKSNVSGLGPLEDDPKREEE